MIVAHQDKWPEMHMKHLELIQNAVTRMGNQSASLKNYCMTLVAGMIGLSAATEQSRILLYVLPIILVFAVLDANYLRLERAFRSQYDSIRRTPITEQPDFEISTNWGAAHTLMASFWSWSVAGFYAPMVAVLLGTYWLF